MQVGFYKKASREQHHLCFIQKIVVCIKKFTSNRFIFYQIYNLQFTSQKIFSQIQKIGFKKDVVFLFFQKTRNYKSIFIAKVLKEYVFSE